MVRGTPCGPRRAHDGLDRVSERPSFCRVLDRAVCRLPPLDAVAAAVAGGVDWIQIRERELDARPLVLLARNVAAAARDAAGARAISLILNRRLDVALAVDAQGAHLGFDAPSVPDARRLLGKSARIGVSVHSMDEVAIAAREGADHVHLAPIHAPLSKPGGRPPLGLGAIRQASRWGLPVLAQGGIDASSCGEVMRAGAAGVAVTGAVLMDSDPHEAAAKIRAALDRAPG